MQRVSFWLKWALVNTSALFFGFWAGSRFAGIVNSIVFAYLYDPSHPSRHLFDAADFALFKTAEAAGNTAGQATFFLICLVTLIVAQWFFWSKHDEPELLWWSLIGIVLLPIGFGAGALSSDLIFPLVAKLLVADYCGYAIGGIVIGLIQWFILRRWISLVGLCILTSAVALPIGFLGFLSIAENVNIWLGLAISGVIYFAISGIPLLWLSPKRG